MIINSSTKCHFAWLIVLALFTQALPLYGAAFQVSGVCKFTSYKSNGPETTEFPFEITVSNCQWAIRITDIVTNQVTGYIDVTYDGHYTYYLDYQKAWKANTNTTAGKQPKINVAVALVGPQEVPHFPFGHQAGVIWSTYASGCYFASLKSGDRIQPSASLGSLHGNSVQPSSFLLQKAYWNLPKTLESIVSPERVVYMDDGIIKVLPDGKIQRWPPPFDQGFTNTIFESSEFTNVSNTRIPLRSRMQTFALDLRSHRTYLRFEYEIMAATVTAGIPTDKPLLFKPRFPGVTLVQDERFSQSDTEVDVSYTVGDGVWLDDEAVRRNPNFANRARETEYHPTVGSVRIVKITRFVIIGSIVAMTLLLIYFSWFKRRQDK